jgi:hypothetical protein
VVGAAGQVLFPRPLVLERHQLVDVGRAVDHALVGGIDAAVALRGGGVGIVAQDTGLRGWSAVAADAAGCRAGCGAACGVA